MQTNMDENKIVDITFSPLGSSEAAKELESELIQLKVTQKSIVMARVSFYRSYRRLKLVPEKKPGAGTAETLLD